MDRSVGLLERDGELDALAAALDGATPGAGSVVTICAPAGMGKTRLLATAGALAAERDLLPLRARGSELSRDVPFALVRELLEDALRGRRAPARARLLRGGAAAAATVLAAPAPAASDAAGSAAADAGATLLGLYWLLANLAAERPLAVLVDDAHWSDARSIDLLEFLAARVSDLPAALIVAARPPGRPEADDPLARVEAGAGAARRLEPGPLSERSVGRLLRERTGRRVAEEFAAACREATGGNPFYIEALGAELAAEGIAPAAAQAARVRELGPKGIARTTLVRLTRVSRDAVAVARTLAVLGDGAEPRHAAAHAGMDGDRLAAAVAALTREGVLADERPARFAHPIVRASILTDLTAADRAALHARAAAVLHEDGAPPERVAVHLLDAEPGAAGPWAAEALRRAAAEARARGAPAVAARVLRRALAERGSDPDGSLVRTLGMAAFEAGEPDALEHLRAAHAGAHDAATRARAALDLALPLTSAGAAGEAVTVLMEALKGLSGTHETLRRELEAQLSGVALLDPAANAEIMRRLEARSSHVGDSAPGRRLLANIAQWVAMRGGTAAEVADLAHRALADERLLAEAGPNAPSFLYAVGLLIQADRFDEADAHLRSALELAQRRGSVSAFVTTSMLRSLSAYRQGALDQAVAEARTATDSALLHGWGMGLPATVGFLVDALIERGELDEAQAALDGSGIGEDVPGGMLTQAYLVARGRLRAARGRMRDAVADLEELGRQATGDGWSTTVGTPTFRTYLAPALAVLGEEERARTLAAEELALARAWGAPRAIGTALRVRGVVGAGEERIATLREAVDTLAATPARLEHARALTDLGAALRRAGQASAAREPLTEAIDLAHRCGARPLVAYAQDELAASGYRRRRRMLLRGVDSLTPSERRIARLAADGLSNVEIAQALFLSRKTIEMHLAHTYEKLGIRSRTELPSALSEPGTPAP